MHRHTTNHAERIAIIERHQAGESLQEIATALGLNYYTVRKWWRTYTRMGWPGLAPKAPGPPSTGRLSHFGPLVKYVSLRLKREHPGWGVDKLLLELSRRPSLASQRLPKRSTLAAYLAQYRQRLYRQRRPATQRPKLPQPRVTEPHQCWQIDFKGSEVVAGCQIVVAPFMVCDEASGAPLAGIMHAVKSKGDRTGLSVRLVQQDLRRVFAQWGLPDAMRMDRDPLFVGSGRLQWPGTLMLWLIGLGITPIINRAFRPTDNAIVERNHWTWQQQALLGQTYQQLDQLQQRTDQDYADRREFLPSRHPGTQGKPPARAFPTLYIPRRPYSLDRELVLFDLARVDRYLSHWAWRRKVDSMGKISLANRNYYVGKAYHRQLVNVHFDPQTRTFVCCHADGQELARIELPGVSQAFILGHNFNQAAPMGT